MLGQLERRFSVLFEAGKEDAIDVGSVGLLIVCLVVVHERLQGGGEGFGRLQSGRIIGLRC